MKGNTRTITIDIPEGYEIEVNLIEKADNRPDQEETKPKTIMDRFKTVNDVIKEGMGITEHQFNRIYSDTAEDVKAFIILKMLCKILNEDWEPDVSDHKQTKHFPVFLCKDAPAFGYFQAETCWNCLRSPTCLLLKTKKLAEYAGTQFEYVWRAFLTGQ